MGSRSAHHRHRRRHQQPEGEVTWGRQRPPPQALRCAADSCLPPTFVAQRDPAAQRRRCRHLAALHTSPVASTARRQSLTRPTARTFTRASQSSNALGPKRAGAFSECVRGIRRTPKSWPTSAPGWCCSGWRLSSSACCSNYAHTATSKCQPGAVAGRTEPVCRSHLRRPRQQRFRPQQRRPQLDRTIAGGSRSRDVTHDCCDPADNHRGGTHTPA